MIAHSAFSSRELSAHSKKWKSVHGIGMMSRWIGKGGYASEENKMWEGLM